MVIRRLIALALILLGLGALALPLRLLAQTQEPPPPPPMVTTPTLAPPPTLAVPGATVTPDSAAAPIPRVHVVADGENMTIIATLYQVTVEEILAINNLANGDLLQVGQELIIPGGTGEAVATAHVVGLGDTLADVAAAYNTTADDLIAANRLVTLTPPLLVGQSLPLVSRTGSGTARPVTGRPYLVAAGDTLLLVAARHGLTPAALAEANGLTADAHLFPGQRLRLPDETTPYRNLPGGWVDVRLTPPAAAQGTTLSIFAQNLLPGTPAGRFGDQVLRFSPHDNGYVALVGIDAFAASGIYELELTGGDERGLWPVLRAAVPVAETIYDTQYIEVGEALDGLLDPAVRAAEDEFLKSIYGVYSDEARWQGVFQVPVTTTLVSAGYGGRRSYNDGPIEIYHTGLDYAAPQGSNVYAPAAGVVVFSAATELRGNVVIIDHGLGVMTGYYHLLESFVEPGQAVTPGQAIGLVGSTGLSSGAHLHWDVRIMNVPVDPLRWLEQAFP